MVYTGMATRSSTNRQTCSRNRTPIWFSLLAICLVAASCGDSSVSSVTTLAPSSVQTTSTIVETTTTLDLPPPDPFHVVGTQILDPNGDVFYPVGANVAISTTEYSYVFEGGNGGVNDHISSVEAWNWNVVRANLSCFSDNGGPTTQQVVAGIEDTVKRLTAARIVVIIECHDGTGSDVLLDSEVEKRVGEFWDLVVAEYKDNPYVWFNFFNEPFESDDLTNWKSLHDFYIDRYRAQSDNIIVVDLPLYGQGLNLFEDNPLPESFTTACNVIFGWHAYGSLGEQEFTARDYKSLIESVQEQDVTIIASEVGYIDPGAEAQNEINESRKEAFEIMVEVAPETGVGLMWWHAIGDTADESFFRLKNDGSGFWTADNSGNLTEAGEVFWEFSQTNHEVDEYDGPVPTGGCAGLEAAAEESEEDEE